MGMSRSPVHDRFRVDSGRPNTKIDVVQNLLWNMVGFPDFKEEFHIYPSGFTNQSCVHRGITRARSVEKRCMAGGSIFGRLLHHLHHCHWIHWIFYICRPSYAIPLCRSSPRTSSCATAGDLVGVAGVGINQPEICWIFESEVSSLSRCSSQAENLESICLYQWFSGWLVQLEVLAPHGQYNVNIIFWDGTPSNIWRVFKYRGDSLSTKPIWIQRSKTKSSMFFVVLFHYK